MLTGAALALGLTASKPTPATSARAATSLIATPSTVEAAYRAPHRPPSGGRRGLGGPNG